MRERPTHDRSRSTLHSGRSRKLVCLFRTRRDVAKRFAHDSLRSNHLLKLAVSYERDLGTATGWCDHLTVGNPVRSEMITQYVAFTRSEQRSAEVLVKQEPVLLRSHLESIVRPVQQELRTTRDPVQKVLLARNVALITIALSTTKRGDELARTIIQRVLRLPNRGGFMFNFQRGKTIRDGP